MADQQEPFLFSAGDIPDKNLDVETLGLVFDSSIEDDLIDLLSSLRNLARQMGGNAVIHVHLAQSTIQAPNGSFEFMSLAYGTAVRIT